MIDIFAKPLGALLNLVYKLVDGMGLDFGGLSAYAMAVIITTVLFKLIILPLNLKQTKSMKEMQKIQPKIKELQEKYKKDPQTLNVKTMELYKEHNVNPFGSCLPLLIQFPILIGFFRVLRNPEKYVSVYETITNKAFLWIKDIGYAANAIGDKTNEIAEGVINGLNIGINIPFIGQALPIMAILAALLTYVQSKMMALNTPTGNSDNPAQASQNTMTKIMPIMIFFFGLSMPVGLVIYWVVGNIFTIAQQYLTNRSIGKIKEESN
ncbi:YidC/Oxa1 family membrane protein insertase [Dethiothermospora halolimnae]|uniref:YidC/Oxa1 family membrane protein insertase n=1 Tax=Dethiothermospora halolimnae TaxID=3114390 RepID=UPI003CCB745D